MILYQSIHELISANVHVPILYSPHILILLVQYICPHRQSSVILIYESSKLRSNLLITVSFMRVCIVRDKEVSRIVTHYEVFDHADSM